MVKFYIGKLEIRNGEYEHEHTYKFSTSGEPYIYLNGFADSFYGEKDSVQDKDSSGFYFHGGAVFVEAGGIQEISEAIFKELTLIMEV